jgi:hypothetical protein
VTTGPIGLIAPPSPPANDVDGLTTPVAEASGPTTTPHVLIARLTSGSMAPPGGLIVPPSGLTTRVAQAGG